MRTRHLLLAAALALSSTWAGRAAAHPATLAYCNVRTVLGGLEVEIDVPLHAPVTAEQLSAALLERVRAATARGECRGRVTRVRVEPRLDAARGSVALGFECPPGPVTLTNRWGGEGQGETLCAIDGAPWVFRRGSTTVAAGTPPRAAPTSLEYLLRGARNAVSHVGHALFLALLLVVAQSRSPESGGAGVMRRALGVTAAFSAGSAITLALAALGLLRVEPAIAAALIALGILVVAIENVLIGRPRWRVLNAGLFGLVHGFGLAAALDHTSVPDYGPGWAAAGFGAGALLVQAALGAGIAALSLARLDRPRYRRVVVLPLSAASAGLAAFVLFKTARGLPAPAWFLG